MVDYVHSHPLDILAMPDDDGGPPQFLIPPGADLEKLRGGPDVTFEGLMPKPGRYRAWTQFRRNDKLYTFAFTFEAVAERSRDRARRVDDAAMLRLGGALSCRVARGLVLAARGSLARNADDNGAVRSRDRPDPGQALRDVSRRERAVVSARDLRADLAAGTEDPRGRAAPPHAAMGGGSGLRPIRQRQQPDAARNAVHGVVGRRLGPRNAGTVFTNVVDVGRAAGSRARARAHFGHWQLGEPDLTRELPANDDRRRGRPNEVKRTVDRSRA